MRPAKRTVLRWCRRIWAVPLLLALAPAAAFAGAGANGGQGGGPIVIGPYTITFGTIWSTSGTPVDFLTTDGNLSFFLSNFATGDDSGVPPAGLDPRIYTGAAGLAASPTTGFMVNFTQNSTLYTFTIDGTTTNNIWFSNGALGGINPADIADPATILDEAESLGALSPPNAPSGSTLSADGSVQFSDSFSEEAQAADGSSILESGVLQTTYQLDELDLGQPPVSATPEPASFWMALTGLLVVLWQRRLLLRAVAAKRG